MRVTSPAADKILDKKYRVLDKGFISLVDYMGNDNTVAFDARRSYQKGTKAKSSNEGLVRRLYGDRHTSPFEMVELKFFVSAPIFVVREWFRHRTASINELSARYSQLPGQFYLPAVLRKQSKENRQGSAGFLDEERGEELISDFEDIYRNAYELYERALQDDVAREQARIVLPVSTYTNFVWKIDLHNFLHFAGLRRAADALEEFREYAHIAFTLAEAVAPTACATFMDNHPAMYGCNLNRVERELVLKVFEGRADVKNYTNELIRSVLAKVQTKDIKSYKIDDLIEITDDEDVND